jgi:hypothetical protein
MINLFFKNLIESLPPCSVWLGASRLQDSGAWKEGTAEPSYYEFERAVEVRIEKDPLTYLRVLCFESDEHYRQMFNITKRQVDRGIHVRCFVRDRLPPDMSLIWVPTTSNSPKLDLMDPVPLS